MGQPKILREQVAFGKFFNDNLDLRMWSGNFEGTSPVRSEVLYAVAMEPGSPEWINRIDSLLAQEAKKPMGLWYLSFAEPGQFLGAVFVEARGHASALMESLRLGINPGGQVLHVPVVPEAASRIPASFKNRLLTRAELDELDASMDTAGTAS